MTNFPDIETGLITLFEAIFTDVVADTVVGDDLDALLADGKRVIRIIKRGGPDDDVTEYSRVDIDVFATTRNAAFDLARDIRSALRPRVRAGSATIDTVRTDASPHKVPWDNADIDRVLASYQISTRR